MARSLTHRAPARHHLISVAGLVGRPVRLTDGPQIGRVADVVVRWASDIYPALTGLVARMAGHRTFVPFARITELGPDAVVLSSSVLDLRAFEQRDGETLLMADVVDHQLVDVNGVQVVRASDLYLAEVDARVRLVGVETGIVPLARRLGPARWRTRATPSRVIDWADIHPAGRGGAVRLDRANRELRRLRPADLADLVESLGHVDRAELVTTFDAELAGGRPRGDGGRAHARTSSATSTPSAPRPSSLRWSPMRPPMRCATCPRVRGAHFSPRSRLRRARRSTPSSRIGREPRAAS